MEARAHHGAPVRALARALATVVAAAAMAGCGGTTWRPVLAQRIDVEEQARIDVEELHLDAVGWTAGAAPGANVTLRTEMPAGTRLHQLMLVSARLPACRRNGLAATSIRLDDSGELDAGIAPDVSGAHRVTASFANTTVALLTGPTAIDWYDRQADGEERCARVALIDPAPDHGWENVSRWSWGFGGGFVASTKAVADVSGLLAFPLRFRRRVSQRGALVATVGLFAMGVCRGGACATASDGKKEGALSVPLGLGYDHALVYSRAFQFSAGARYEPHFMRVPLETGARWRWIHEMAVVPRVALGERVRSLSGLPGNAHGTSVDLEVPVGVWMYGAAREVAPVVGGMLTFNASF